MLARDLKEFLPSKFFDSYFKFAFIRNPWDWQVSEYHYILKSTDHEHHKLVNSFNDFSQYLQWRVKNGVRLQKDFITDEHGDLMVDFVGRFENLYADFEDICQRLDLQASLPHENKSRRKDYRHYYTPELISLVAEAYRDDVLFFGYQYE
jgi:hypothetical protein